MDTPVSFFNVFITGQIESATFPLGPGASEIFCRYEIIAGQDWELLSGLKNGITQSASNKGGNFNDKIVFNMPIEVTYKSTSPYGWPQLIVCIYGKTRWGHETVLGYSRAHVPCLARQPGPRKITAPIIVPNCTNMISELGSWISGKNPELKHPKVLLDNSKCKGLSVESYGEICLTFNVISRGISRLGYNWD